MKKDSDFWIFYLIGWIGTMLILRIVSIMQSPLHGAERLSKGEKYGRK